MIISGASNLHVRQLYCYCDRMSKNDYRQPIRKRMDAPMAVGYHLLSFWVKNYTTVSLYGIARRTLK